MTFDTLARMERIRRTNIRLATAKAERNGEIPTPAACEACGAVQQKVNGRRLVEWHHPLESYGEGKHLDNLIPLCRPCHRSVHVRGMPEPRTGRVYAHPGTKYCADREQYFRSEEGK